MKNMALNGFCIKGKASLFVQINHEHWVICRNFFVHMPLGSFQMLSNYWYSQQDNNFGYISQFTNLFLQKKFSDVPKCPLNNCGLNPIESSYFIVENKVCKKS
jgi:hypothetical protein